ncbi:energy transducer TonB [bacterium]|nr:energy transducer TonB [bacterium]
MKHILLALILSLFIHISLVNIDLTFTHREQMKPTTVRTVSLNMSYRPAIKTIVKNEHTLQKKKVYSSIVTAIGKNKSSNLVSNDTTALLSSSQIKSNTGKPESLPSSSQQEEPHRHPEIVSASPASEAFMSQPRYRYNPAPEYPKQARRKEFEGTVILEVLIDTDGSVNKWKISKSSGYSILDQTAIRSVKKWIFEPKKNGVQAVTAWVKVPVHFQLK